MREFDEIAALFKKEKPKDFKVGEIIVHVQKAYLPRKITDITESMYINSIEIGEIKELNNEGAFVYFHQGDTTAKVTYDDLYKIKNSDAFILKRKYM